MTGNITSIKTEMAVACNTPHTHPSVAHKPIERKESKHFDAKVPFDIAVYNNWIALDERQKKSLSIV